VADVTKMQRGKAWGRVQGDGFEGVDRNEGGADVCVDEVACEAHAEVVEKAAFGDVFHCNLGVGVCKIRGWRL